MNQRKINTNALSGEQLDAAIKKITQQIDKDIMETCARANVLLARFGLKCQMQIAFQNLEDSEPEEHDKIEE